ncbi:MAG: hypothetical protein QOE22_361 [Candidatus Parcubacteria bacterium]|jgi:8-oxo-dGTP pyrophosphatase MutT (NUDIX family)|nr:hypothetical protein [Candidatus Parcubacteria bacterium]
MKRTRSAGGIVLGDSGTVVLVQHRSGNGMWLFPKGRLEDGESDGEAARREIAEETGLSDIEFLDDLGSYERHPISKSGTDDRTEMKQIHMFLFAAKAGAGLAPTEEIGAAKWVPLTHVAEECGSDRDRAWFATVYKRVREAVTRD